MNVFRVLVSGLKMTFRFKWMILIPFSIQFLLALFLSLPLRSQLDRMIGHSLMGEEILKGTGWGVYIEFLTHYSKVISVTFLLLILAGVGYLIISIFFNGGILSHYVQNPDRFSFRFFFKGAAQWFGRFLKLFLWSIPYIMLTLCIYVFINLGLTAAAGDSEIWHFIMGLTSFSILLFLFFLIQMAFDYAKIIAIDQDEKKMFKTSLMAWKWIIQHLGRALGLYYLVFLIGLVLWGIYITVGSILPKYSAIGIFVVFLWQQGFVLARITVRMLCFSSQTTLYKRSKPISTAE
jgi:hypothetical protein